MESLLNLQGTTRFLQELKPGILNRFLISS